MRESRLFIPPFLFKIKACFIHGDSLIPTNCQDNQSTEQLSDMGLHISKEMLTTCINHNLTKTSPYSHLEEQLFCLVQSQKSQIPTISLPHIPSKLLFSEKVGCTCSHFIPISQSRTSSDKQTQQSRTDDPTYTNCTYFTMSYFQTFGVERTK